MIKQNITSQPTENGLTLDALHVISITHVFGNPTWRYQLHSHDAMSEVIFVTGGRGYYIIGDTTYPACAGDILAINAGILHALSSDPIEPLDAWTLTVAGFQLPELLENHIISDDVIPILHGKQETAFFESSLQLILSQQQEAFPCTYELSHACAASLLLRTYQLFQTQAARGTVSEDEPNFRQMFALKVINYIDKHFSEPISLEMLADTFHVSAGHISHTLTREYGISPVNYLISRRIGEAQWLLITTTLTVNEIAQRIGYENTYHFSNLFTKRVGMRPLEFRERYQASGQIL